MQLLSANMLCLAVNCSYCRGAGNRGFCNVCNTKVYIDSFDGDSDREICPACYGQKIRRFGDWYILSK